MIAIVLSLSLSNPSTNLLDNVVLFMLSSDNVTSQDTYVGYHPY